MVCIGELSADKWVVADIGKYINHLIGLIGVDHILQS